MYGLSYLLVFYLALYVQKPNCYLYNCIFRILNIICQERFFFFHFNKFFKYIAGLEYTVCLGSANNVAFLFIILYYKPRQSNNSKEIDRFII